MHRVMRTNWKMRTLLILRDFDSAVGFFKSQNSILWPSPYARDGTLVQ